jgi:hypothetical protein
MLMLMIAKRSQSQNNNQKQTTTIINCPPDAICKIESYQLERVLSVENAVPKLKLSVKETIGI